MTDWPFPRVREPGFILYDEPTSAEFTQLDLQQSLAADGRTWTDVAALGNFPYQLDSANGGRQIVWNPVTERFYSLNLSGTAPLCIELRHPFFTSTAKTVAAGAGFSSLPAAAIAVHATLPRMVMGGAPASSSQQRYRYGDGGSWTVASSAKSAGTDGPKFLIPAFGYFYAGYLDGTLERSVDGIAWADVTPGANQRTYAAYNPNAPQMVIVRGDDDHVTTTSNGTSFAGHDSPEAFHTIFWSDYRETFFAVGNSGTVYSNPAPASLAWTTLGDHPGSTGEGATRFFEYGRLIGVLAQGRLAFSLDGCASFIDVGSLNTLNATAIDPDHGQILFGDSTGNHLGSLRIAY